MLRLVAASESVLVNSLAGPCHDWAFVEDVTEAIERARDTPRLPHDVYPITAGGAHSTGDMLAVFQPARPGMEY